MNGYYDRVIADLRADNARVRAALEESHAKQKEMLSHLIAGRDQIAMLMKVIKTAVTQGFVPAMSYASIHAQMAGEASDAVTKVMAERILCDPPELCQPMRFEDQECDDQAANNDELKVCGEVSWPAQRSHQNVL